MTYQEQLKSNEWINKRTEIVTRDNWECKSCGNEKITKNKKAAYIYHLYPHKYNLGGWMIFGNSLIDFKRIPFHVSKILSGKLYDSCIVYYIEDSENKRQ